MAKTTRVHQTTYRQFVHDAHNTERPKLKAGKTWPTDRHGEGHFRGTRNNQQAHKLATEGWDIGIEAIAPAETKLAYQGNIQRPTIAGSKPNFNAVHNNSPLHFYKGRREVTAMPRLVVYMPLSYKAGVDVEEVLHFAKNAMEYIAELNRDYDLCLVGVFCSKLFYHAEHRRYLHELRLKDYGDQLVINNVAYAYHPSMMRRTNFRYLETSPYFEEGFGATVEFSDYVEEIKALHVHSDEAIILPSIEAYGHDVQIRAKKVTLTK